MVLASATVAGWTGRHACWCGRGVAHGLVFSLVHVSLVAGVSAWTLCHIFSLLGEQSHFSRQQMPWLWGISALLFPAVSMCLLGRPAFSRPPRKWPALAHVLPGWP